MSSVKGMLVAPGMWPELRPGRGSGAVPLKRAAERASRTCWWLARRSFSWEWSMTASL